MENMNKNVKCRRFNDTYSCWIVQRPEVSNCCQRHGMAFSRIHSADDYTSKKHSVC